jgi:hypothetical protein
MPGEVLLHPRRRLGNLCSPSDANEFRLGARNLAKLSHDARSEAKNFCDARRGIRDAIAETIERNDFVRKFKALRKISA